MEISRKEIFKVFYIAPQSNNENSNCLFIIEKNRALKIYDLKAEQYKFTFFMKLKYPKILELILLSQLVPKSQLPLCQKMANILQLVMQMVLSNCIVSDQEIVLKNFSTRNLIFNFSNFFLKKIPICLSQVEMMESLLYSILNTKEVEIREIMIVSLVICILFFIFSKLTNQRKCIMALDMSDEFIATADEVNEVKIWSAATFHNIFTLRIPSEYDPQMCFEFVDGAPVHKTNRNDSSIIDLRFSKERANEHIVLVLEARGCIHILNAREGKVMQIHAVNIGQNACFDLEYDNLGMRLYSFDSDLNIRIFYKNENVDLDEFKSQALNPINFERKESIVKRRVTFMRDDSLDQSQFSLEISPTLNVPRKTVHKNIFAANTRKRNKAVFNRNTEEDEVESSVVNPDKIGWAFYLVTKIAYPQDTIPVKGKNPKYFINFPSREMLTQRMSK